ncbi:hypothetical protein QEJ31_05400 [Pigmentibacter sp. JX0631]|uniref:hypothetical protein n=1 Tax=Pigmentibacter sp. JX0631 TaxID=2976982 RepID=UPI0024688718|nr:hypothetical protein [Pigmentibacter sp. JX0631]WGL61029.1 hypothetical protein QEJ31_05400 [Pigmentibacter sp. JX0631]
MKRYLYKFLIISNLIFLIGCKNNSTNKNYSPEPGTQNPANQIPEIIIGHDSENYDPFSKIEKSKNLNLPEFGANLFEKYCDSNEYYFVNCDFRQKKNNKNSEIKNYYYFTVDYTFEKCNFDKIKIHFSGNYRDGDLGYIEKGKNTLQFENKELKLDDSYEWYTVTSKFQKSCSFKIDKVDVKLNKINEHILNNAIKNYINPFNSLKDKKDLHSTILNILNEFKKIDFYNKEQYQKYIKQIQ